MRKREKPQISPARQAKRSRLAAFAVSLTLLLLAAAAVYMVISTGKRISLIV